MKKSTPRTITVTHAEIGAVIRKDVNAFGGGVWRRRLSVLISYAGYRVVFAVNILIARLWLLRNRHTLARMARLVPMQSYSFGIVIEGMDSIRRLWRDEVCGVLAPRPILGFRLSGDANRWLPDLEGGFNIFLYPAVQGLNVTRPMRLINWPADAQKKFQSWLLPVLAQALPDTEVEAFWFAADRFLLENRRLSPGNEHYGFHVGSAMLRLEHPAPAVRLRPPVRRQADDAVRAASAVGNYKRANFYIRQKNTTDEMSSLRNGGPFADYLPAFQHLFARGYLILLNGDGCIPSNLRDRFKGQLLDAKSCGLDRAMFSLFAATECDVSIGEPGGGFWLPTMNAIPSLMINAFPMYMGREHTTLLFKTLRTATGERLSPEQLLRGRLYDHCCDDLQISTNSADEIAAAVDEFLDFAESGAQTALQPSLEQTLPWDSFAKICRSRYSPIWLAPRQ